MGFRVKLFPEVEEGSDTLKEDEVEIKIFPIKFHKRGKVKSPENRKKQLESIFLALFVVGLIVFSLGIMFKETFTFIIGLGILVTSMLFLKLEQYKRQINDNKTKIKRTVLATFLLIVGIIGFIYGLVVGSTSILLVGAVIAVYDFLYLLKGKKKIGTSKDVKKEIIGESASVIKSINKVNKIKADRDLQTKEKVATVDGKSKMATHKVADGFMLLSIVLMILWVMVNAVYILVSSVVAILISILIRFVKRNIEYENLKDLFGMKFKVKNEKKNIMDVVFFVLVMILFGGLFVYQSVVLFGLMVASGVLSYFIDLLEKLKKPSKKSERETGVDDKLRKSYKMKKVELKVASKKFKQTGKKELKKVGPSKSIMVAMIFSIILILIGLFTNTNLVFLIGVGLLLLMVTLWKLKKSKSETMDEARTKKLITEKSQEAKANKYIRAGRSGKGKHVLILGDKDQPTQGDKYTTSGGSNKGKITQIGDSKSSDAEANKYIRAERWNKRKHALYIVCFVVLIIFAGVSLVKYKNSVLFVGLGVLIITFLGMRHVHKKYKKTVSKRITLEEQQAGLTHGYQTDLDKLYEMVIKYKTVNIKEAAERFKVSNEIAEKWGVILEQHGLVEIYYPPVGWPTLAKPKPKVHVEEMRG